ncbi:uncharacterized protein DUF4421 [Chitinophaga skermanii]|uniref:Uncharacterized protein DUF4421 n=1 Tax=Chitinophaga skermanii TaxID=331697 RepID=A0A327QFR3_9BACT|nr:DUF4421 domain-containing protein [Chitinophaga skermanii]RAJ02462.1 uncharacterized protein DUF4421 [Chitinophaga skermanii]
MRGCFIVALLLLLVFNCQAQTDRKTNWFNSPMDSNYVEDHTEDLTVRLYGSRKYTYFDIVDHGEKSELLYKPNSNMNVGVGFNYKFIGINIGFNLPFINDDDDRYGKTKYLDLQSHLYLRKMVIDFYGQYYKGYYLANPKGTISNYMPADGFPKRPDIYNLDIGASAQYIFNNKRFSYRAAYLQNEYQKKSAGSFMLGGEVFAFMVRGDSSLIPRNMQNENFYDGIHYDKTKVFSLAVNGGYAYTLVFDSHFFITASLSGAVGMNSTRLYFPGGTHTTEMGWQLNTTVRFSAGYNSSKFFAGVHYVDMKTRSETPIQRTYQTFGTGNFRVSIARRFGLKKPLF